MHFFFNLTKLIISPIGEETERITNWLAPITFAKTQVDIYDIAQDGTGQWFVNGTAFRDWITALGTTLWCPGIGK